MATIDKVKEIIAKQLNKNIEDIDENLEIVKDLGADSLDIVEIIMSIEEEFNISVPDEKAINVKTVKDIVSLLDNK